jgi:hypothetical protein
MLSASGSDGAAAKVSDYLFSTISGFSVVDTARRSVLHVI